MPCEFSNYPKCVVNTVASIQSKPFEKLIEICDLYIKVCLEKKPPPHIVGLKLLCMVGCVGSSPPPPPQEDILQFLPSCSVVLHALGCLDLNFSTYGLH